MKGYKGMTADMTCRGMKYEIGKTYHEDNITLCERGLHFCKNLHDVFRYYRWGEANRFFEVGAFGKVIMGDNKYCTSDLTIIKELSKIEVNRAHYGNGCGEGYIYDYGEGYSYGEGYGCGDGNLYGEGYYIYGDGYGYHNGNGYGNHHRYSNGSDYGYGTGISNHFQQFVIFKEVMMKTFIIEAGWIIVGKEVSRNDNTVALTNASVVRKWSNGRGIGGIAKAEYKDEYTLDAIGDIEIAKSKILFEIPCEWEE